MESFCRKFYQLLDDLQKKKNVEENLSEIIRFLKSEIQFQSMGIFLKTQGTDNYRLKISRNISHNYAKTTQFNDRDQIISELKNLKPLEFDNMEEIRLEKDFSHLALFPLHNNRVFLGFLFIDLSEGKFGEQELMKTGLTSNIISVIVDMEIIRDKLAHTQNLDDITGFLNYSAFFEKCEEMFIQMRRYKRPLSIVILKVDDYEKIVRTIGSDDTDALIRSVTKGIKDNIRGTDILGKLYRDVYGVLMPETTVSNALNVVKRMDDLISRLPKMDNINIGWGLLELNESINDLDDLISKAREAALESCRKSVYKYTVYQD